MKKKTQNSNEKENRKVSDRVGISICTIIVISQFSYRFTIPLDMAHFFFSFFLKWWLVSWYTDQAFKSKYGWTLLTQ